MSESLTRIISWNVNGLRACLKKGFLDSVAEMKPDVLCLQETKVQAETLPAFELDLPYRQYHYADKKGYSGTALMSRVEPLSVEYDFPAHKGEGRTITAEFENCYVISVYVPNSKDGLLRLDYRTQEWDPALREWSAQLSEKKPVLVCGDLNVAHQEIDIARPGSNHRSPGFTDEEREQLGRFLDAGFIDTFRHCYPDAKDRYSWWSFRARARERNVGWRIDYVLASQALQPTIADAFIWDQVFGSDHCPVGVDLKQSL